MPGAGRQRNAACVAALCAIIGAPSIAVAAPASLQKGSGSAPAKTKGPAATNATAGTCELKRAGPRLRRLCQKLHTRAATNPSTFAVGFVDLRDGQRLYIRPDEWMHAASTYKTAVMVAVFDRIKRGKLRLGTPIRVTNRFRSIVDGSRYRVPVSKRPRDVTPRHLGKTLPVSVLIEDMITISSNLATNLLLEKVSAKRAMQTMRRLGVKGVKVLRGVQDIKAFDRGMSNEITARGLTRLYELIGRGKAISRRHSKRMVAVLLRQRLTAKLRPFLPHSIKMAHKGGTISTVSHDAGIAYHKGKPQYVITLMSRGYKKLRVVDRLLARMSRDIYLHVAKKRGWGRYWRRQRTKRRAAERARKRRRGRQDRGRGKR